MGNEINNNFEGISSHQGVEIVNKNLHSLEARVNGISGINDILGKFLIKKNNPQIAQ